MHWSYCSLTLSHRDNFFVTGSTCNSLKNNFYQWQQTGIIRTLGFQCNAWWRHQMKTFSALLALCAGNSPVSGEFPAQRPVTRSFGVVFDLRLIKRLSKHSRGWWFETLSRPLWRHCNGKWNQLFNIAWIRNELANPGRSNFPFQFRGILH